MLRDTAPAKINLFLHVRGRRADGYHELESLVSFASVADEMVLEFADTLSLTIDGPFASAIAGGGDNLVLGAARAFAAAFPGSRTGRFRLTKNLPVASGIGGGSSDAACALRMLAGANAIPLHDPGIMECARALGADVPVCLERLPRMMHGIGHDLGKPLPGEEWPVLLVNPGVAVETGAVFTRLGVSAGEAFTPPCLPASTPCGTALHFLDTTRNDLEEPAMSIAPVIRQVLETLGASAGCRIARMSGSGATCFAIFDTIAAARQAAEAIGVVHAGWWVAPCRIMLPSSSP